MDLCLLSAVLQRVQALHMLGRCSATELHLQAIHFLKRDNRFQSFARMTDSHLRHYSVEQLCCSKIHNPDMHDFYLSLHS